MTSLQTESRPERQRGNGGRTRSALGSEPLATDETPLVGALAQAISEAAYHRAAARGFEPGHELEDWVEAEKELTATIRPADAADG
jgi:hypothetical protein